MNPQADVNSIQALQDWFAALTTFRSDAIDVLDSIGTEVRRAFDFVEQQEKQWKGAVRDCEEEVIQAKAELNRRKVPDFSGKIPDTSIQEENLRKAQAKLKFAQEQVEVCRKWAQKLPRLLHDNYDPQARRLGAFLEAEVPQALAHLQRQITNLEAYAAIRAPEAAPPPAPEPGKDTP